jgi:hypothetical protein
MKVTGSLVRRVHRSDSLAVKKERRMETMPRVNAGTPVQFDAAASHWLREAYEAALARDPVDAAADAAVLADLLARRCDALLSGMSHTEPEGGAAAGEEDAPSPSIPEAVIAAAACGTSHKPLTLLRRVVLQWRMRRRLRRGARAYATWSLHHARVRRLHRARGGSWPEAREAYYRETGRWIRSARAMRGDARRLGLR